MSIFRFVRWIDEEKELILYGDGSQSRDFTYVDDIAEGTIKSIGLRGFEIINLGGNEPHSLLQAISVIENALGKKAVVKNLPFQKTDVQATWADISRAQEFLSWEPKVSLAAGLKATVNWYQANKAWVKNIQIDMDI